MADVRVLHVVTNSDRYPGSDHQTGLWLSELTHAWEVFEQAGFAQEIMSPAGGASPLEPRSLKFPNSDASTRRWMQDSSRMELLDQTLSPTQVDPSRYDAIFLTGGHGVMDDFTDSAGLHEVIQHMYEQGAVVSSACHGYCGLLNVRLSDGGYLIDGKQMTGFSWREEQLAGVATVVPYNAEAVAREHGGQYSKGLLPFLPHVVVDGRLVTGQNPSSAHRTAQAVVRALG